MEHPTGRAHTSEIKGWGGVSLGSGGVAQMVKNPPVMQETQVQSLGREDPLEKGMATHSSILAWRIPIDRGAWRATVHGVTKSRRGLRDYTYLLLGQWRWGAGGE